MKYVYFLSIFMLCACYTNSKNDNSQKVEAMITETFNENVEFFQTEGQQVTVGFSLHAGMYRVSKSNTDFENIMQNIMKAWQQNVPLTIELKGMEVASAKL